MIGGNLTAGTPFFTGYCIWTLLESR